MYRRVVLIACTLPLAAIGRAGAEDLRIRLSNSGASVIEVSGLSAADLAGIRDLGLKGDDRTQLMAVYVVSEAGKARGTALLGEWRIEENRLCFHPRFPLQPGVHYRAVFNPGKMPTRAALREAAIESDIFLPKPKTEPARLVHVYPSADRLPENLLKFYLHFSAPMSRGGVYKHIKLLDRDGKEVDVPFLELDEELWDAHQQRLTLFCDPGRIKRGLKPREEDGPILQEGRRYTLVVDTGLEDANGNRLQESFRKTFQVLPPDDSQPDPKKWKLRTPAAGTRDPLEVTLSKPLDHALLERLVYVTDSDGRRIGGSVSVEKNETLWRFTPQRSWDSGNYRLVVDTRLEDLAGNNIARPFEVDVFHPVQRAVAAETVRIPFDVPTGRRP